MATPLTNRHYVNVWHKECTRAVSNNPTSQADLYLSLALNELIKYLDNPTVERPLQMRQQICMYFREAGKTGHPRGLFFEGMALLEGFGCQSDRITGRALIRVAAFARNCDLALQYLILRLGQQYLHLAKPNYPAAIKCFSTAGHIAAPDKERIAAHFAAMRAKLMQPQVAPEKLLLDEAPRVVSVALRAS
jgi:hypothetical protein